MFSRSSQKEFEPQHKLIFSCDRFPRLANADDTTLNSIGVIKIKNNYYDLRKFAKEKLLEERDQILDWMIQGIVKPGNPSIGVPPCIRRETNHYRYSVSSVMAFNKACVKYTKGAKIQGVELYNAYEKFCKSNEYEAVSNKLFGEKMKNECNRRAKHSSSGVVYLDISFSN